MWNEYSYNFVGKIEEVLGFSYLEFCWLLSDKCYYYWLKKKRDPNFSLTHVLTTGPCWLLVWYWECHISVFIEEKCWTDSHWFRKNELKIIIIIIIIIFPIYAPEKFKWHFWHISIWNMLLLQINSWTFWRIRGILVNHILNTIQKNLRCDIREPCPLIIHTNNHSRHIINMQVDCSAECSLIVYAAGPVFSSFRKPSSLPLAPGAVCLPTCFAPIPVNLLIRVSVKNLHTCFSFNVPSMPNDV